MIFHGFQVDPENIPLKRAGLYRFTCLVNGKPYIGISQNVAKRARSHGNYDSPRKFRNALKKYGKERFLLEPLAYAIDDTTDWLLAVEADWIAMLDTIRHGYNVVAANGGVGPYGPEFSKLMKEAWAKETPEKPSITSKERNRHAYSTYDGNDIRTAQGARTARCGKINT